MHVREQTIQRRRFFEMIGRRMHRLGFAGRNIQVPFNCLPRLRDSLSGAVREVERDFALIEFLGATGRVMYFSLVRRICGKLPALEVVLDCDIRPIQAF